MGRNILMAEVFVSNNMKQKRNYKHYLKNKARIALSKKAHDKFSSGKEFNSATASKDMKKVTPNSLLLAIRMKGFNSATTPQA